MIDPDEEYSIVIEDSMMIMQHDKCGQFISSWPGRSDMKQLIEAMYIHEEECPDRAIA